MSNSITDTLWPSKQHEEPEIPNIDFGEMRFEVDDLPEIDDNEDLNNILENMDTTIYSLSDHILLFSP